MVDERTNRAAKPVRTAILVSGGGSNLQAIIAGKIFGEIENCEIVSVISSNPDAYALERAKAANIPTTVIDASTFPTKRTFNTALMQKLTDLDIEFIVLAGFMQVLQRPICKAFENRIINVHPSLIPSFCGDGFYGLRVHQAVLDAGVRVTGATVHFVTEDVDAGPIILQKAVDVELDDTPKALQKRVMEQAEWILLPQAIDLYCRGRISVVDGKTVILTEKE